VALRSARPYDALAGGCFSNRQGHAQTHGRSVAINPLDHRFESAVVGLLCLILLFAFLSWLRSRRAAKDIEEIMLALTEIKQVIPAINATASDVKWLRTDLFGQIKAELRRWYDALSKGQTIDQRQLTSDMFQLMMMFGIIRRPITVEPDQGGYDDEAAQAAAHVPHAVGGPFPGSGEAAIAVGAGNPDVELDENGAGPARRRFEDAVRTGPQGVVQAATNGAAYVPTAVNGANGHPAAGDPLTVGRGDLQTGGFPVVVPEGGDPVADVVSGSLVYANDRIAGQVDDHLERTGDIWASRGSGENSVVGRRDGVEPEPLPTGARAQ
jgi:hypothetical protein